MKGKQYDARGSVAFWACVVLARLDSPWWWACAATVFLIALVREVRQRG